MPRRKHEPSKETAAGLILTGDRPKGEEIRNALLAVVNKSRPGELLPSERVLAEQFGVARMTVRGCLEAFEDQGLVRREPGRGTFVGAPRASHTEAFRSFSEDMRLRGLRPGSRVVGMRQRPAGVELAGKLGIAPGDQVYFIQRVRTADGVPMALERTNLAAAKFPGLTRRLGESTSLYELLATRYGVQLETADQRVSIASLTRRDAELLEAPVGAGAFLIERRSLDNMGKVVEFGRSLYRGDRYEIFMHVTRKEL